MYIPTYPVWNNNCAVNCDVAKCVVVQQGTNWGLVMLALLFAQMKYARGTVVQCNKENRSYVRNIEIEFRHRNVGISKIYGRNEQITLPGRGLTMVKLLQ